jgi:hypothetical protein
MEIHRIHIGTLLMSKSRETNCWLGFCSLAQSERKSYCLGLDRRGNPSVFQGTELLQQGQT